jgi:radical SAM protein with 4Fe4S-binding SPASM domain
MKDPFYIQWHFTNFCNLRCRHCYQEDFSKAHDLDRRGLEKVSDNMLGTLKCWNKMACIHLTGGEPILKPELFWLLDYLNPSPFVEELGVITNGVSFDQEILERLSAFSKLTKIKISLDGADAETNDSIRPKGSFERVIQNLALIKEKNRFEVILMFTVMKKNYKGLSSFYKLCQDLGVDGLILERFIPLGRGKEMMNEVLDRHEWRELVETLFVLFSVLKEEVLPYQAFGVMFRDDGTELLGAPCIIGKDGLCIMPEGTVLPCRRFPVAIGNLLNDSLKDIWERSEILEKLRKKENLRGKCGRCEIEDCRGCRSLVLSLTGDYLEEDPHCWMEPR